MVSPWLESLPQLRRLASLPFWYFNSFASLVVYTRAYSTRAGLVHGIIFEKM